MIENSKGKVFYGMHFYPGVARYETPNQEPFTVLINENVIREMGPSFEARPVFVQHVEDVDQNLDTLREEADGWVIESFFNQADGKHWVKFIVTSELGLTAVKRGWKLSNAYLPQCEDVPGQWNAVPYDRVVTGGEYEHLAIVQNPRYEESVIMTPEQFKTYNEKKTVELKRLANSNDKKGEKTMKLNFFKRAKIENSPDLEGVIVELPKSKKEVAITKMVEEYDKIMNMNGYANDDHMVKYNEKEECSVKDLVKKHQDMQNELSELKAKNEAKDDDDSTDDDDPVENDSQDVKEGEKEVGDRGGDQHLNAEDDEDDEDDKDKKEDKKVKNAKAVEAAKKLLIREKALRLKNAHLNSREEDSPTIALPQEQVARGKSLYGSSS